MEENTQINNFLENFDKLRDNKGNSLSMTDVRILVEQFTEKSDSSLYQKIFEIAVKIHNLKDEIEHIDADAVTGDYLPGANFRLEAVVEATEKATHDILDAASTIQDSLEGLDDVSKQRITEQITKIFEACNFQDLTGQHINNVVGTLETVEQLIKAILKVLPEDFKESVREKATQPKTEEEMEKELMQGPHVGADGLSQDDIDKIFAES